MSSQFIVHYEVLVLKHYVRSCLDDDLQQILQVFRKVLISNADIDYVLMTLRCRCSENNVSSWDLVPENYFRVVSKRQACSKVVEEYISNKLQTVRHYISVAMDEVKLLLISGWKPMPVLNAI